MISKTLNQCLANAPFNYKIYADTDSIETAHSTLLTVHETKASPNFFLSIKLKPEAHDLIKPSPLLYKCDANIPLLRRNI